MIERVSGSRAAYELNRTSRREGGQAEVFEARAPSGASHAVRMPRGGDTAWFKRELAAIEGVFRRNRDAGTWLVSVVDSGTLEDGRPFFVMPWYSSNLSEWLRRQPPLELRLRALELASRAVARLHHSGEDELDVVVHRDLKPSNFLVREDGDLSVLLTDLGAARSGALFATAANTVIYTRNYAPPEQQLPIPLPADPSLDVHAMGVTIYAGLVGRIPTAVINREALRTERGARLLTLHAHGDDRRAEEEAEFQELSRLPLSALFDLDAARALFPSDEAMLTSALCDQLASRHAAPEALADRLVQKLLPALRRALDPDPTRRLGDARVLQAACHHALDLLIAEGLAVGSNPVTSVIPVEAATATGVSTPTLATGRRERRPALVAAAALLAASLVGVVGIGWYVAGGARNEPVAVAPMALVSTPEAVSAVEVPAVDVPPTTIEAKPVPGVAPALKPAATAKVTPARAADVVPVAPPVTSAVAPVLDGPVKLTLSCPNHMVNSDGKTVPGASVSLSPGSHRLALFVEDLLVGEAPLEVADGVVNGPFVSQGSAGPTFTCPNQ